tara:strand:+ start:522 stop:719 length:198 start_codon:yes stop_codon:yes gene_type:complete
MDKKKQKFIDKIDEGFRYFDGSRLAELNKTDSNYINLFMIYIEELESQIQLAHKQLKKANEILSS